MPISKQTLAVPGRIVQLAQHLVDDMASFLESETAANGSKQFDAYASRLRMMGFGNNENWEWEDNPTLLAMAGYLVAAAPDQSFNTRPYYEPGADTVLYGALQNTLAHLRPDLPRMT